MRDGVTDREARAAGYLIGDGDSSRAATRCRLTACVMLEPGDGQRECRPEGVGGFRPADSGAVDGGRIAARGHEVEGVVAIVDGERGEPNEASEAV